MIKHPLTKKELAERKKLYEKAKHTLTPNKKSGKEILSYLKKHYPSEEIPENVKGLKKIKIPATGVSIG